MSIKIKNELDSLYQEIHTDINLSLYQRSEERAARLTGSRN